ncbi:MAG: glycosyltransferase family 87 protein [Kiloniellales bacterium]|nr:glycosyltransferase family 87 protein [Kiloniellales bacterium]
MIDDLKYMSWLTPARLMAYAAVFAVVSIAAYAIDLSGQTAVGLSDGKGRPLGDDFVNYWSAAVLAVEGRTAEIYDLAAFNAFQSGALAAPLQPYHFSYPPVALVLLWPLAALPYVPGLAVWLLSGLACFWAALSLNLSRRLALLAAVATPAVFINAVAGQNGVFSAALLGGGLTLLPNRPALAGVLIGLLCYKPQLGLLIPFALAAAGQWRAFLWAAATVAALFTVSLAWFGEGIWADYLARAELLKRAVLENGSVFWHRMPSIFAALRSWGVATPAAYGAQLATALIAFWVTLRVWRSPCEQAAKSSILLIATFLVSPYAVDYDMVVLIFVVALTAAQRPALFDAPWVRCALAGLLLLPMVHAPLMRLCPLPYGPAALLFALWAYQRALGIPLGWRAAALPAAPGKD